MGERAGSRLLNQDSRSTIGPKIELVDGLEYSPSILLKIVPNALYMRRVPTLLALALITACTAVDEDDGFTSLFNGTDLSGWDGDPALWKVENGIVIGTCEGSGAMENNSFLIWRGGTVEDFELRVTMRVVGDNNSGIQYRSRERPDIGPWVISGYQCDVHPAIEHTGMTYEEKGRGIFGLNGKSVMLDSQGERWLTAEHEPVDVDVSEWNEYTVIAQGNRLIHTVNGQLSSELIDCHDSGRSLQGLLAIQLHRGNPNRVEIKDLRIKNLPKGDILPFIPNALPEGATRIDKPRTSNPQGLGPVLKAN